MEADMPWLQLYNALVVTGLLGSTIWILRDTLRSKDAAIESQKAQIELLKTQSVTVVHQANEALRVEIEELQKRAVHERDELLKEREGLVARIRELENKLATAEQKREMQNLAQSFLNFYDKYASTPPSGTLAESLNRYLRSVEDKQQGFESLRERFRIPKWKTSK